MTALAERRGKADEMQQLTFGQQAILELISALGTALFVTVGGGVAAWYVSTRSQDSKARHERRAQIVQEVAALTGSLLAKLDAAWEKKTSRMLKDFAIEASGWVGDGGETCFPTTEEMQLRVRERMDDSRLNQIAPGRPYEERFEAWAEVDAGEMEDYLLSLAVLETSVHAYYGSSSSALHHYRTAIRMLAALERFVAGEFSRDVREKFVDVLDSERQERFGIEGFAWLREVYAQKQTMLIDRLLSEPIRLG